MKKILFTTVVAATLSACTTAEPIVSGFNGDSVNIIQPAFSQSSDEQLQAKADDICSRGHKKFAERVSQRALPNYEGTEYLFLCLERPR